MLATLKISLVFCDKKENMKSFHQFKSAKHKFSICINKSFYFSIPILEQRKKISWYDDEIYRLPVFTLILVPWVLTSALNHKEICLYKHSLFQPARGLAMATIQWCGPSACTHNAKDFFSLEQKSTAFMSGRRTFSIQQHPSKR